MSQGLVILAGFAIASPARAYELTMEQALDIASDAYQKQFKSTPYGQREISIARSDDKSNACTLVKKDAGEEQLHDRHYFTVIFWNVKQQTDAQNHCIFIDRISGDVIGTGDF
jgi:hypothetical protein